MQGVQPMRFETVYPGTPKAQARARHGRGFTYTPAATREAQAGLKRWLATEVHTQGFAPITGPVRLVVRASFVPPKSWPKYKKQWAIQHQSSHTSKPDADNLAKLIKDAANGVLWCDDSQVAHVTVVKHFGPVPQTVIACEELPGIPQSKKAAEDLCRLTA